MVKKETTERTITENTYSCEYCFRDYGNLSLAEACEKKCKEKKECLHNRFEYEAVFMDFGNILGGVCKVCSECGTKFHRRTNLNLYYRQFILEAIYLALGAECDTSLQD